MEDAEILRRAKEDILEEIKSLDDRLRQEKAKLAEVESTERALSRLSELRRKYGGLEPVRSCGAALRELWPEWDRRLRAFLALIKRRHPERVILGEDEYDEIGIAPKQQPWLISELGRSLAQREISKDDVYEMGRGTTGRRLAFYRLRDEVVEFIPANPDLPGGPQERGKYASWTQPDSALDVLSSGETLNTKQIADRMAARDYPFRGKKPADALKGCLNTLAKEGKIQKIKRGTWVFYRLPMRRTK